MFCVQLITVFFQVSMRHVWHTVTYIPPNKHTEPDKRTQWQN